MRFCLQLRTRTGKRRRWLLSRKMAHCDSVSLLPCRPGLDWGLTMGAWKPKWDAVLLQQINPRHWPHWPSLSLLEPLPQQGTAAAAAAKSLQLCLTLCDPMDGSPPGSAVPGILQARTLEGVAISFSSAWKGKVKVKSLSRARLLATPWTAAYQAPPSMGFSR